MSDLAVLAAVLAGVPMRCDHCGAETRRHHYDTTVETPPGFARCECPDTHEMHVLETTTNCVACGHLSGHHRNAFHEIRTCTSCGTCTLCVQDLDCVAALRVANHSAEVAAVLHG